MLWVLQKGNLSLFSTNTDGCCFEWGLVLVKHDKVRDDTPLVTKVWRSSNASAVAFFFSQDNLLFMYQLPIKGKKLSGQAFRFVCFAVCSCWSWEMGKWTKLPRRLHQEGSQYDSSLTLLLSTLEQDSQYLQYLESVWFHWGHHGSHVKYEKSSLHVSCRLLSTKSTAHYTDTLLISISSN